MTGAMLCLTAESRSSWNAPRALNRWARDRCCRVKIKPASATLRAPWFKPLSAQARGAWGGTTWRERGGKVNAWNRWPTDQALPHHHRGRHQHRGVRESGEAAGGGPGRISRAARGSAREATWGGFFADAFPEKTWSCALARSQSFYSPPGAYN